jgi:hypothetical protein
MYGALDLINATFSLLAKSYEAVSPSCCNTTSADYTDISASTRTPSSVTQFLLTTQIYPSLSENIIHHRPPNDAPFHHIRYKYDRR